AQRDLPRRQYDERAARESLPSLEPDEARVDDEHAVLLGDVAHDPLPPHHARRERLPLSLRLAGAAGGRGAGEDEELSAVERGDRRRERVPGVLANEYGGAPEARVEGAHLVSPLHEALFVEHAVGREEHLAVHVL